MLSIFNEAIVNSTALYDYKPRTEEMMQAWFAAKAKGNFPVIGVENEDGELMGFASYGTFRGYSGYRHTVEHSVYVRGDACGQGIGTALLVRLEERARAQGLHVMIGALEAGNAASLGLHAAQGFAETGRMPEVGRKFGRWLTLVLVQKIL